MYTTFWKLHTHCKKFQMILNLQKLPVMQKNCQLSTIKLLQKFGAIQ